MSRFRKGAFLSALLLAGPSAALAQETIEWQQTLNVPKGQNLPKDVSVDILGLTVGDTYDEAKSKLLALAAETAPKSPQSRAVQQPPISENRVRFTFQGPSGQINANYVGEISLERELPGSGSQTIDEKIRVFLSAPSSAHQVTAIERSILYRNQADQPSVAELIQRLKEKLKTTPQPFNPQVTGLYYRFQYNDGVGFVPPRATMYSCVIQYEVSAPQAIPDINPSKTCDVLLQVDVRYGISQDHAQSIVFTLSDNERAKANATADFAFFDSYVRGLTSRPKGAAPRL